MKKSLFKIFIFLLSALCSLLSTSLTFASIDVDPVRIEIEVSSGQTHTGYLTLSNYGDKPKVITVSCDEYRYMLSRNTLYIDPAKSQLVPSCKNWISLLPDRLNLEKGAKRQVEFKIKVPDNSTGEYLAAILVDIEQEPGPVDPNKTGQVSIKITPRISLPVYVMIKQGLKRSCLIEDFKVSEQQGKDKVDIQLTLKNTGTVHLRPVTTLTVINQYEEVADRINLGKSLPVFPSFGERLHATIDSMAPGRYSAIATVDIGTDELVQKSMSFEIK